MKTNSKIKPATALSKAKAKPGDRLMAARAAQYPEDHPTLETLPGTDMNFIELELAIETFWKRNLDARKRLGLRPNQDIRTAKRPNGMAQRRFEALTAEIDDATYGFLEGLSGMWGHSIVMYQDPDDYIFLGQSSQKAPLKVDKPKAKNTGKTKKPVANGARA